MDGLLKNQTNLCRCICQPDSILQEVSIGSNHSDSERIILNVGGMKHEVLWSTLVRIPKTRLTLLKESSTLYEILKVCDKYTPENNEYYFDRDPKAFRAIINFYRTGKLHYMDELCVLAFTDDLEYWGINELYLESCCQPKYQQRKKAALKEIKREWEIQLNLEKSTREKSELKKNHIKDYIWTLLEEPGSSVWARIVSSISIIFVILSTIALTLETVPEFQTRHQISRMNANESQSPACDETSTSHQEDNVYFYSLEVVTIAWFTVIYLLRLYASPDTIAFLKKPLNIIDLLAILPYFVGRFLMLITHKKSLRSFVQFIRLMRILRILKLARHSTGLQSLGYTFRTSYKELGLYTLFLFMAILIFSTLAYFAEHDTCGDTEFKSIPVTFWWALNTMTTVVYDGFKPATTGGRIISSICGLCGVIVVALPIPIIVNNFTEFYSNQMLTEAAVKRRKELHIAMGRGDIVLPNHWNQSASTKLLKEKDTNPMTEVGFEKGTEKY